MKWNKIDSTQHIKQILEESKERPVLIYKHSTRCNISRTALDRLERHWKQEEMGDTKVYYLDLISYREVSNLIAEEFEVEHESPQVLIIRNEKSMYDRSHFEIDYHQIKEVLKLN